MSLSKEGKIRKKTSLRTFQGHRPHSTPKLLQRKFFTKTNRPRVLGDYRIVNVKCHVPSPTTLAIHAPRSQVNRRESRNRRLATPTTIVKRMEEVKNVSPSSPQNVVKKEKETAKCDWHSIIKKEREAIKNEWEHKTKMIRERQQMVKERYSSQKMKELYVNPNRDRIRKRSSTRSNANDGPKTTKRGTQKSKTETTADEILSEAHKMIWFWLFNGLFPTGLRRNTEIKKDS